MSDDSAGYFVVARELMTVAQVLEGVEPMGDLGRFVIDDLTPEDEDEFFSILENA